MSDGALHSGRVIHLGGLEGRAAAGIEPAEELIELEPQRLDADEDGLYQHDERVAEDEPDDGVSAAARLGESVDNEHHDGVADGVGADSQEAQAVGEPGEKGLEQLEEACLVEGEQEELEQEAETLSHAEEIKAGLYRVEQSFASDEGGLLSYLKDSLNTLNNLQRVYQPAKELTERMESAYIELKDISHEVSLQSDSVEFNPVRLDEVNERLNLIYSLQQKHRAQTLAELIALTDEYRSKLSDITSYDERIAELTARKEEQYKQVKQQAEVLTKARTKAAREVEKQLAVRLIPLGMPNVRFQIEMGLKKEPGLQGEDTVNFLFSANKNGTLQNISSVASGGEIARVMLSIKAMIAGAVKLPTIVFDEIDTGVSGEIADRMADMMQEMGDRNRQVISITHLPQIAARGRAHYKVYKKDSDTETNSHIRRLTDEERVEEIAHMLSGATLTEAALSNAKALLARTS